VIGGGEGPLEFFLADNLTRDRASWPIPSYTITTPDSQTVWVKPLSAAPAWPAGLKARPAAEVKEFVLKNAGARPWGRDEVDQRIVGQVREGKGRIIDSQEEVGGYPHPAMTTRKLDVPATGVDEWLAGFGAGGK